MACRVLQRVIFVCLLSILTTSHAKADSLPVGALSFNISQFGTPGYELDVFNGTQAGGGSPVSTFLNFTNLSLSVTFVGGGTITEALISTDPFGDFSTGAIFSAGQVLSATLTGTFSPVSGIIANGNTVDIGSSFTALLADLSAGSLQDGDFINIFVTTTPAPQATPEPGVALLLLIGLSAWMLLSVGNRKWSRLRDVGEVSSK